MCLNDSPTVFAIARMLSFCGDCAGGGRCVNWSCVSTKKPEQTGLSECKERFFCVQHLNHFAKSHKLEHESVI